MTDQERSIVLLAGPIGAGKTTVARQLVKNAQVPAVHLEGDLFWKFFIDERKYDPSDWKMRFRLIMRSMALSALPFARAGYTPVVDFTFPPRFLEFARKHLKGAAVDYVILCPSEEVCAARAASRSEGKIPEYGQFHDLYLSFGKDAFPDAPRHTVSDDVADPAGLAARIAEGLARGDFRVSRTEGAGAE